MRSLVTARATCEAFLPGLLARLSQIPLDRLEQPGSPAVALFREHHGPGLVIPKTYAGAGATPLEAVQVTRALGAAAPSLAVATTMHHFSVATLFTLADSLADSGMEWALLEGIASSDLLVASGFAEGRPGQGILTPSMAATRAGRGWLVSGAKKPCSLSESMNLLTASVALPVEGGGTELAVLLIPRDTPGVSVHPFWRSWALAGAESHEVRLREVFVQDELMMRTEPADGGALDELQTVGLIWFELLITASYLGMVSALVERVLAADRGSPTEQAEVLTRVETAAVLLDGVARMVMDGAVDNEALARTLVSRYAAQDALGAAVRQAVELLGGMAYVRSAEVAYLAAASHGLSFHPPSRSSITGPLLEHYRGSPLRIA
jgi:alkylation response protein AidB-like acyl-CoA dehydrogenase